MEMIELDGMLAAILAIVAFVFLILLADRLAKYLLLIGFVLLAIIILVVIGAIDLSFDLG